jgi:hypothetical protein
LFVELLLAFGTDAASGSQGCYGVWYFTVHRKSVNCGYHFLKIRLQRENPKAGMVHSKENHAAKESMFGMQ